MERLSGMSGYMVVVWLPWGVVEDTHTDGHVDNVCAFVRPGAVIMQTAPDPTDPNHTRMNDNLEMMRAAEDASGNPIEIIPLPLAAHVHVDGQPLRVSYLNFYIANGGVILPLGGHADDAEALAIVGDVFPDHEVVGVTSRILAFGGGGIHCITQQVPSVNR